MASIPKPEEQPLLGNELSPAPSSATVHPDSQDQSASSPSHLNRKQYIRLLVCAYAVFTLTGFAGMLLDVPLVRLLERAACQDYYLKHPQLSSPSSNAVTLFSNTIDETRCKLVPIQSRVATLLGGKAAFDAGAGLPMAIVFGSRADKHGRKPVLIISFTGELVALLWVVAICYYYKSFTIELVWLSSCFLFLGGGSRVFFSMIYTMLADAVERSQRTRAMYWLSSLVALTSLFAPPVGAWLMKKNIMFPFLLAISLELVCYPLMLAFPETLNENGRSQSSKPTAEDPMIVNQNHQQKQIRPVNELPQTLIPSRKSLQIRLQKFRGFLLQSFELFFVPNVFFVFTLFFLKAIAGSDAALIFQYASKKFDYELSNTAWLLVVRSSGAFLITGVLLPAINAYILRKTNVSTRLVDFWIVRASLLIITFGYFAIFAASNTWTLVTGVLIWAAGAGIDPALQGLMISFVNMDHNARVFTTVTVLETSGRIIGGPLMAKLFSVGLNKGGWLSGLCYLVSSGIFAFLTVVALCFKLDRWQYQEL